MHVAENRTGLGGSKCGAVKGQPLGKQQTLKLAFLVRVELRPHSLGTGEHVNGEVEEPFYVGFLIGELVSLDARERGWPPTFFASTRPGRQHETVEGNRAEATDI